ncbi:MAG: hypothetical protein ABSC42_16320 [Tepidisphaeraceae bacterium]
MATNVRVEHVAYREFADSLRITNGTIEAIVVPSIGGRLMRFAMVGGNNVLWKNPTVPTSQAGQSGHWGGEISWPWPQDQWLQRTGRAWPPPPASDQYPYDCQIQSNGVRLISQTLHGYDARIVRQFTLASRGAEMTEEISLEPAGPAAGQLPAAVWSIAEVPVTKNIFARQPGQTLRRLGFAPWPGPPKVIGGILILDRPAETKSKVGLDADLLAVVLGRQLLSIEIRSVWPAVGYVPGEKAQLYSEPDSSPEVLGLGGFTELEFTSPTGTVGAAPVRMTTVWKLEPLTQAEADDPVAIARKLSAREHR